MSSLCVVSALGDVGGDRKGGYEFGPGLWLPYNETVVEVPGAAGFGVLWREEFNGGSGEKFWGGG
jgi:hypothetical protein